MPQTPSNNALSNSASPEIIWGLGGPEEDHQLHHCCWTGLVGEREEEEEEIFIVCFVSIFYSEINIFNLLGFSSSSS